MFRFLKIFLLVLILSVGAYFAFPMVKERYFDNETPKIIDQTETKKLDFSNISTQDESPDGPESPAASTEETTPEPVSQNDCESECSGYDTEKYKNACLEECQLTNVPQEKSDCAQLLGSFRDSCWKEKAIKDKNFTFCDNIISASVKKSCQDRLTEELLDSGASL